MHVICFSCNTHIANYIGIKYLDANKISYLALPLEAQDDLRSLQQYYQRKQLTKFELIKMDYTHQEILEQYLRKQEEPCTIILPHIEKAAHFTIYHTLSSLQISQIFIESDGNIFKVSKGRFKQIPKDDVSLTVQDFIRQTKGNILDTGNHLFTQKPANQLLDYYLKHLPVMVHILKDIKPMKSREKHSKYASPSPISDVSMNKMTSEEQKVYMGALRVLTRQGIIKTKRRREKLEVIFIDLDYRDYFSKSGTWLEHFVLRIVSDIPDIDDALSSVFFMWDKTRKSVKNEIDVMATYNNRLIAISCKDSRHIIDDYLYELEAHSEILSEDGAVKIIATTATLSPLIKERASILGIHIVAFNGNVSTFKNEIEHIITSADT